MAKAIELKKYTKDEIIWALGQKHDFYENRFGDTEISGLIADIELKRAQDALEKENKLMAEANEARNLYFNFLDRMRKKYGDETGSHNLLKLSKEELEEGCQLEEKWTKLRDKELKMLKENLK